jgi:hypothetical protein
MCYRIITLFLISLSSCASVKSKKDYIRKEFTSFYKYSYINELGLSSDKLLSITLSDSGLRKVRMKALKADLKYLEHRVALGPDSIAASLNSTINPSQNNNVDSFYINPEKIKYIRRNGLVTPGKHFIERTF